MAGRNETNRVCSWLSISVSYVWYHFVCIYIDNLYVCSSRWSTFAIMRQILLIHQQFQQLCVIFVLSSLYNLIRYETVFPLSPQENDNFFIVTCTHISTLHVHFNVLLWVSHPTTNGPNFRPFLKKRSYCRLRWNNKVKIIMNQQKISMDKDYKEQHMILSKQF